MGQDRIFHRGPQVQKRRLRACASAAADLAIRLFYQVLEACPGSTFLTGDLVSRLGCTAQYPTPSIAASSSCHQPIKQEQETCWLITSTSERQIARSGILLQHHSGSSSIGVLCLPVCINHRRLYGKPAPDAGIFIPQYVSIVLFVLCPNNNAVMARIYLRGNVHNPSTHAPTPRQPYYWELEPERGPQMV